MKAMILAAGIGSRLRPLSTIRPKPLFPIYSTPLLGRLIRQLQEAGVKDIVVNSHHLNRHITSYLEANMSSGLTITHSYEADLLGTAGALKKVEESWNDTPFIVTNGDIIHTIDLKAAYHHHTESGNLATLVLHDYPRYNQVEIAQDGTIVGIRDDRVQNTSATTRKVAFTGIHIISPQLLKAIPSQRYVDIISVYLQLIARGEKVRGYQVENHYWLDIGTPHDYHRIHQDIHNNTSTLRDAFALTPSKREPLPLGTGTILDGYVAMGTTTTIGENCTIKNSILWDDVKIDDNLTIEGCIIGDGATVKRSLHNEIVV
jgi:NDP-sugar pyrophosphorylase family protein